MNKLLGNPSTLVRRLKRAAVMAAMCLVIVLVVRLYGHTLPWFFLPYFAFLVLTIFYTSK
ncbi:MAG: hypothetical protein M3Y13_03145 [Armatimonadota bacterium]|nr:hypothetical protein [Armatimonadota bacterium]